jgi:hypothetical protein
MALAKLHLSAFVCTPAPRCDIRGRVPERRKHASRLGCGVGTKVGGNGARSIESVRCNWLDKTESHPLEIAADNTGVL